MYVEPVMPRGAIAITAHHTDTQRAVDHVLAWMLA